MPDFRDSPANHRRPFDTLSGGHPQRLPTKTIVVGLRTVLLSSTMAQLKTAHINESAVDRSAVLGPEARCKVQRSCDRTRPLKYCHYCQVPHPQSSLRSISTAFEIHQALSLSMRGSSVPWVSVKEVAARTSLNVIWVSISAPAKPQDRWGIDPRVTTGRARWIRQKMGLILQPRTAVAARLPKGVLLHAGCYPPQQRMYKTSVYAL